MRQNRTRWFHCAVLLAFFAGGVVPAPRLTDWIKPGSAPAVDARLQRKKEAPPATRVAVNPTPTVQVDPPQGYGGQAVTVTGTAPEGFRQVRVAWWIGDSTQTQEIVLVETDLSYAAVLTVPGEAAPGEVQICAAVAGPGTDSELAEFACAPFNILPPPLADLTGTIPLPRGESLRALSANVLLMDQNGSLAVQTPIASDGSFSFSQIPPGNYLAIVEGGVPILVEPKGIPLAPGGNMAIDLTAATWAACTYMPAAAVSDIVVTPGLKSLSTPGAPKTVGTFLSLSALGPIVNIHLQAPLQVAEGMSVQRVEFWMTRPDGFNHKVAQDSSAPYEFNYNASLLSVGKTKITAKVIMTDGACTKSKDIYLHAIGHPFNSPILRNDSITWNATLARYEFSADIPNLPGHLPARYPDPPPSIPLIGTLKNEFDLWQHLEGYLYLNRGITLHLMEYHADARVLSQSILNKTEIWWNSEHAIGTVDGSKPPKMGFGPSTLMSYNKTFPVFSGPLWTFAGIVTVNASIKVGFKGDIRLQGTLEPWTPAASMRLMPTVSPYLPISIWLDLLLLIGKVGITATTTVGFSLPLEISTKTADPVYFDDPCVSLVITLEGWAEIYYVFDTAHWDLFDWKVLNKTWGSCTLASQLAAQLASKPDQVNELRSLPAPEIASSPSGQMAMVYVEDTTPAEPSATPQVMARFYDSDANDWGPAMPVSEAGFFVKDPAIAFVGPDGAALAVWSQNTLTRAQGAALGQDVSAIFSYQEIFYSVWNGSDWTAPLPITSNTVADGTAAIAGDSAGGATLAWVTDTDGNLATQSDVEINTLEWNNGWPLHGWGEPQRLSGRAPVEAGLDAQVRVIRPASRTLTSVMAWTSDLDADLRTNADRTLIVSRLVNGEWIIESLNDVVSGADSPTIAWDEPAQTLHLAFLKRGKDEDGVTDTGIGNLGQLWTGQWDSANGWMNFQPILQSGQPVFAEQPKLLLASGQDLSLLFRRFGEPGTPGEAGALALSQFASMGGGFSPPLYLKPQSSMNWMQVATVLNDSPLVVVSMNRTLPLAIEENALPGQAIPPAAGVHTTRLPLAGTAETLETGLIEFAPDPALDAALDVSPLHSGAGTPLEINAVLRNLGREAAADITLNLYSGAPGSGTLLQSQTVPGPLAFNESQQVNFSELSTGGPQPFYVELVAGGPDLNPANNTATGDAGVFPAPEGLNVQANPAGENSLLLSWMPPAVPGVTGFRILRSETSQGPYELVGLSLGNFFEDLGLPRGKPYFYIVQAYDAAGNWSAASEEASGQLPLAQVYLPRVVNAP